MLFYAVYNVGYNYLRFYQIIIYAKLLRCVTAGCRDVVPAILGL